MDGEDQGCAHGANSTINPSACKTKTTQRRRITSHYEFASHTMILAAGLLIERRRRRQSAVRNGTRASSENVSRHLAT